MPTLEYFLVAESIIIDQERNLPSVINILEDIQCVIPVVMPQMVAFSSWIIKPEDQGRDFQVSFELITPNPGDASEIKDFSLNFTAATNRQRAYFRFVGIPITQAGDVVFHLKLNGEHKATHVLTIRQSEEGKI